MNAPVHLGVDTGGTYTDAVLWNPAAGRVVAKAKALTTHAALDRGIAAAVDRVMAEAAIAPGAIGLVSLSTTLATNALVEGHGAPAALVMIGFEERDIARAGLREALGADPVLMLAGGHSSFGNEAAPLDLDALRAALPGLSEHATAFAVAAQFATRNPAHELAAKALIRDETGLPVTASHELTARLGGPRRALTAFLNARLVGLLAGLVDGAAALLAARGIDAPLMVVRGDGALMSAATARERPIETILSGPAASLVGAAALTGLEACVVSDIGGTTTDIAALEGGRPRRDPEGAVVGGWRTLVEAAAIRTFGLGADSIVGLDAGTDRLTLGPRRATPVSLLALDHPALVAETLDRQ
ncbi:MAG: hydantoinase/oxoprolinase family protein, partial [Pseudomonadota bacterium]